MQTTPTPEQAELLKKYYRLYSNEHLADLLKVRPWRISYWLKLLDLRKLSTKRRLSEKIALNYTQLQNERDKYIRWYNEQRESNARMARRIAAPQGVITKMKKAK